MRVHALISLQNLTQARPSPRRLRRKTERSAPGSKGVARAIALAGNKICSRELVYRK